jgi:K+-transporting ATPase A subunit
MASILWAIFVIILIVWIIGLVANIGGGLINLLLIVAAAVLIYNLTIGRTPR